MDGTGFVNQSLALVDQVVAVAGVQRAGN